MICIEHWRAKESCLPCLKLECAQFAQDAARYRWLRDKSPGQFEHPIVVMQARADDHLRYVGPLAYAALDAAIDAALAKA